jgi:hypothetical protein
MKKVAEAEEVTSLGLRACRWLLLLVVRKAVAGLMLLRNLFKAEYLLLLMVVKFDSRR